MKKKRQTTFIGIARARAQFSRLVRRAEAGGEVVITRAGSPVARIVPLDRRTVRQPGSARGRLAISADFDDFLADFGSYGC